MKYKINPLSVKRERRQQNINKKIIQLKNGFRYNHKLPSDMEVLCGKIICKVLGIQNCDVIFNERISIFPFELDIYIPSQKLAFEVQDKSSHYGDKKVISDNNKQFKKIWCTKLGIRLIHIPYNFVTGKDITDLIKGNYSKIYKRKEIHYNKIKKAKFGKDENTK